MTPNQKDDLTKMCGFCICKEHNECAGFFNTGRFLSQGKLEKDVCRCECNLNRIKPFLDEVRQQTAQEIFKEFRIKYFNYMKRLNIQRKQGKHTTMKRCNHEGKMYPIRDSGNWNVGYLCDCGYFVIRQDMPKYEESRRSQGERT